MRGRRLAAAAGCRRASQTLRGIAIAACLGSVLWLGLGAWARETPTAPPREDPGRFRRAYEERSGDFWLLQVELPSLARFTYVLASGGRAVVVDPPLGLDAFLQDLDQPQLVVQAVVLTGTHGSFVAGHREIAERTGAAILAPSSSAGSRVPRDEETIRVGQAILTWWQTPGALPDGRSLLVRRSGASDGPEYVVTGDLLTVGGLGEPCDPRGEVSAAALADQAFDSLERLRLLPASTRVLPSLNTSRPGAPTPTTSTMATESERNPWLALRDRAAFVARASDGLPAPPAYLARVAAHNASAELPVRPTGPVPAVDGATVLRALERGAWLVDPRPPEAYAARHVRGAVNLPAGGPLERWWATIVPPDAEVYVLAGSEQASRLRERLARVACAQIAGCWDQDPESWRAAGLELRATPRVTPKEVVLRRAAGLGPLIVDVRSEREWRRTRIVDSLHLPVETLGIRVAGLPDTCRLLFACATGYRSSLAIGLAERAGLDRVEDLAGGILGWEASGVPLSR